MRACKHLVVVLACLVGATGCARIRTDVSGTITRDGKPLVWEQEGGYLLVIFVPENRNPRGGDTYPAETDRDTGTYRIKELRAGKYLVAIQQFNDKHVDALGHKFTPYTSPLRFEVTEDGQVIDIDLPKDLPK